MDNMIAELLSFFPRNEKYNRTRIVRGWTSRERSINSTRSLNYNKFEDLTNKKTN